MSTDSPRLLERFVNEIVKSTPAETVRWHYENGLICNAIWLVAQKTDDENLFTWILDIYNNLVQPNGTIKQYKKEDYNLDQINPGKLLFDIYAKTNNIKYRKAIEALYNQLQSQPRTESLAFWHKKIYPWQVWLDGFYMYGPFYARYALEFGTVSDFEDILTQLFFIDDKLRDKKTGLMYHAWDESRKQLWANQETGCSPHFLGRGMGLYCMAIIDILDYIPIAEQYKNQRIRLLQLVNKLAEAVLSVQDEKTGMWFQILDQGTREKNFIETAASSMFVYFLFKGIRKSYFDVPLVSRCKKAADNGYKGICNRMVSVDENGQYHLDGICTVSGLGGFPYRDGSFDYYVREPVAKDDFKGLGPFILATVEKEFEN